MGTKGVSSFRIYFALSIIFVILMSAISISLLLYWRVNKKCMHFGLKLMRQMKAIWQEHTYHIKNSMWQITFFYFAQKHVWYTQTLQALPLNLSKNSVLKVFRKVIIRSVNTTYNIDFFIKYCSKQAEPYA